MMIYVDLALLAPVFGFLLWLYAYTRPGNGPARRWPDRLVLLTAPVLAVVVVLLVHRYSEADGMARNVIAVASAYLVGLAVLAAGWWYRHRPRRRSS